MAKEKPSVRGQPKVTFMLRMTNDVHTSLKNEAGVSGVSLNDFILMMVSIRMNVCKNTRLPAQEEQQCRATKRRQFVLHLWHRAASSNR